MDTSEIMDSRDLEERLTDLIDAGVGQDLDDIRERAELRKLRAETEGEGWEYGIVFVRDNYFEDYARELAEDVGAVDRNLGWPACHIDWEAAAESLKMDYSEVEIDGATYYYREA